MNQVTIKEKFLVIFSMLILTIMVGAEDSSGKEAGYLVHDGLSYSTADSSLTLDLFLPKDTSKRVPCVVVIQGGGFRAQTGQKFRPFAVYLAEHGFAAALIAYRGAPNHRYLDTVADTKAAVRFIRSVSDQYEIDADRMGAMGRSAGGTLAGLLAVTGDMDEFEGNGGHPEYSSRIQAAVAFAGVFDFVARFTDEKHIALQPGVETKVLQNGAWVGPPFSATDPDWLSASAINHVDAQDPPMLFLQCKDDSTVPWRQSQEMYERMNGAGIDVSIRYYETGGHGFKDLGDEPMDEMVEFFKEKL